MVKNNMQRDLLIWLLFLGCAAMALAFAVSQPPAPAVCQEPPSISGVDRRPIEVQAEAQLKEAQATLQRTEQVLQDIGTSLTEFRRTLRRDLQGVIDRNEARPLPGFRRD